MNLKELQQWGYEILNWTYTIEHGKLIRVYYKDISSLYPSLFINNYKLGGK